MTREKAIKTLKENYCAMCAYGSQDMDSCDIRGCDNRDAIQALDQEPCDDAISRQAVLDQTYLWSKDEFLRVTNPFNYLRKRINDLPSVTPQQSCEDIAKAFQLGLAFGFGEKHDEMDKIMEEVKKVITPQPEPCGDAISRKAACDAIRKYKSGVSDPSAYDKGFDEGIDTAIAEIGHNVSSVSPQQKTGNWIKDHCSVCGKGIEDLIDSHEWYRNEQPNFCPFCGVKLVDSQESEE